MYERKDRDAVRELLYAALKEIPGLKYNLDATGGGGKAHWPFFRQPEVR